MIKSEIYINNILARYFPSDGWSISTGGNGVNNTTRFIEFAGKKYVLRIYETHQDENKVEYEHSILMALQDVNSSLRIPVPVGTADGNTIVRTEEGKLAALFHHLEGMNPTLEELPQLTGFGWATGKLTEALERVHTILKPAYRPYYEIENTHPRCSLPYVIDLCNNPMDEFIKYKGELAQIGKQLAIVSESISKLKQLPHQLIHGDLNASNVLVDSKGQVTAILDFEFVTKDLRVMELAVCLSDLMHSTENEALLWERVDRFLGGYGSVMKLSYDEVAVLPLLILLRRLDVFVHFLGRYMDGVNSIDIVVDQIYKTASQTDWINANEEKLMEMCKKHILI